MKCCAVEMAEAEQTLSFYQKAMQSANNVVTCKKVTLDNMEKSLAQLTEEMKVQLVSKMGQIEVPLRGCFSDYESTVLVPHEELLRVNDRIVEAGKRKLAAIHKSIHLRKVVAQHEWEHTCAKMVLDDLQQELKDVREFKVEFYEDSQENVIFSVAIYKFNNIIIINIYFILFTIIEFYKIITSFLHVSDYEKRA